MSRWEESTFTEILGILVIVAVIIFLGFGSEGAGESSTQDTCDDTYASCKTHCQDDPFTNCSSKCDRNYNSCSVLVESSDLTKEEMLERSGFEETLKTTGEHTVCLNESRICVRPCIKEHKVDSREMQPFNRDDIPEIVPIGGPRRSVTWDEACVSNCRELNRVCEAQHGHGYLYRILPVAEASLPKL